MGIHLPPVTGQDEADRFDDIRLILDDQNMSRHATFPSPGM
jgi:hypothetical protein